MSRDIIEEAQSLSTTYLKDYFYLTKGGVKSGNVSWTCRGEPSGSMGITVDMKDPIPTITFNYRVRSAWSDDWTDMNYSFNLISRPCNYGGERWYFQCGLSKNGTFCGKRVMKIHSIGDYFGCRNCGDLIYQDQNESKRYKKGVFGYFSKATKAEEYYRENVKTEYYNGKPTKKYRQYLKMIFRLGNPDLSSIL